MTDHGLMIFREQGQPVLVFEWTGRAPRAVCGWGLAQMDGLPDPYSMFARIEGPSPWPTPDPASQ